jgi:hypothetical protein
MGRDELSRLLFGPELGRSPGALGTTRFIARCQGDADAVLRRAREVLGAVLRQPAEPWPSDEQWKAVLPKWFVDACAPAASKDEAEKWLRWWRTLDWKEQARVAKEKRWSLPDWIYWFHPENRYWFWWDAVASDPNTLIVAVETRDWPFPWESLAWLLRASGARDVEPEE